MAQFTLNWFNTTVLINAHAIAQRAVYRRKSVGGVFITTGFTPANDLPKTAITVDSPILLDNNIYEFDIRAVCTGGGETGNTNGIVEKLQFACINPVLINTDITADITLNVLGTDITKARFTLKRLSDNVTVSGPIIVVKVGNAITYQATGLVASTEYYWEVELYATVNAIEIISSGAAYLNGPCITSDFETDAPLCVPCTSIDASAMEL